MHANDGFLKYMSVSCMHGCIDDCSIVRTCLCGASHVRSIWHRTTMECAGSALGSTLPPSAARNRSADLTLFTSFIFVKIHTEVQYLYFQTSITHSTCLTFNQLFLNFLDELPVWQRQLCTSINFFAQYIIGTSSGLSLTVWQSMAPDSTFVTQSNQVASRTQAIIALQFMTM